MNCNKCAEYSERVSHLEERRRLLRAEAKALFEDNRRLRSAIEDCGALGGWMSAAIGDPKVRKEMRQDIAVYFKGLRDGDYHRRARQGRKCCMTVGRVMSEPNIQSIPRSVALLKEVDQRKAEDGPLRPEGTDAIAGAGSEFRSSASLTMQVFGCRARPSCNYSEAIVCNKCGPTTPPPFPQHADSQGSSTVEQSLHKAKVEGSNPSPGTTSHASQGCECRMCCGATRPIGCVCKNEVYEPEGECGHPLSWHRRGEGGACLECGCLGCKQAKPASSGGE